VLGRSATPTRDSPFPTRRSWFGLAAAFFAFAIYGSLLPFDFQPVSVADAWDLFRHTVLTTVSPRRISRSDFLANVLLFVPAGFTLAGALLLDRAGRRGWLATAGVVLPVSLAVSLLAEFLQIFTGDRIPSNTDIAAQTMGALLGIVTWAAGGERLTTWLREALAAVREDRLSRLLTGFAACWIFVNLAPFDITVDLGDLAARVRSGKISIVPFGASAMPAAQQRWDALAETLSALPLGMLGLIGWNKERHRSPLAAFAFGAGIVAAIETAQLFIRSHSATATDLIFGLAGVAVGVAIGSRIWQWNRVPDRAGASGIIISRGAVAALAVWCLVLCAYHWLPYDFAADPEGIKRKLGRISLLPFGGYQSGSYLNAFNNLLTKLALAAPLGVGAAFVARDHPAANRLVVVASLLIAACIFGAIELGQFLLPKRVPDPTDVLVGIFGTYAGLSLGRWALGGRRGDGA
jgi:VanZ family protein